MTRNDRSDVVVVARSEAGGAPASPLVFEILVVTLCYVHRPGLSPPPMLQSRRGAQDRAGRRFATYAIKPSHGFGPYNVIYLTRTITRHKTYNATYAEDRTDHGTR